MKNTLKPGMRVLARQNIGPVFQGETGLFFHRTYSVAGPALFVWEESRKAQRAHWTDVEIMSEDPGTQISVTMQVYKLIIFFFLSYLLIVFHFEMGIIPWLWYDIVKVMVPNALNVLIVCHH